MEVLSITQLPSVPDPSEISKDSRQVNVNYVAGAVGRMLTNMNSGLILAIGIGEQVGMAEGDVYHLQRMVLANVVGIAVASVVDRFTRS